MYLTDIRVLEEEDFEGFLKYIRECYSYDRQTGLLSWNSERPLSHFKNLRGRDSWLRRYAGKEFLNVTHQGYKRLHLKKRGYLLHRLVFLIVKGRWPKDQLDHIDGDKTNNRFENLREVSNDLNSKNKRRNPLNKSGHNGVHWDKVARKYSAQGSITQNGKTRRIFIGRFKELEEAVKARRDWQDLSGGYTERHGK